jgi:hypothetical protein
MYIKQVRTKRNTYSAVQYDNNGNLLIQTKAAKKARAKVKEQQIKCTALTKKKKPCPNLVDAWRNGTLCHVHDSNGKFKQQVQVKRKIYKETNDKQLAKAAIANKNKKVNTNKWRKLTSKYENVCVECNGRIYAGEQILWHIKTKQVKHVTH